MTTLQTFFVVPMAMIVSACATVAPVPVMVDTTVPAVVETAGLRATLRVLLRGEADWVFGDGAGGQLGVVELNVENKGALPMSVERKSIRIVTPAGKEVNPLSPLSVANLTRRGSAMISTGNNVLDTVTLLLGLAALAQNHEIAAKWDPLMPATFKVAPTEERRMLLAFPTPDWAPGLWHLELPFIAGAGVTGPRLSIPLTFNATARQYRTTATGSRPPNNTGPVTEGDASSGSLASKPADDPGQDARHGRDAKGGTGRTVKVGADSKGFDFTKIANDGSALPDTAALGTGAKDWACTRDNARGLMWEIKTTSGLRSQNHRYTWYNSNAAMNGGSAGTASTWYGTTRGSCAAAGRCDTEKYAQDVNAVGLCGHNDWRMPDKDELMPIADYRGTIDPAIDNSWFPNTRDGSFWSASAYASDSRLAWFVPGTRSDRRYIGGNSVKYWGFPVRLVRAGQ